MLLDLTKITLTRAQASMLCRDELLKHGLTDWHVRYTMNANSPFLGLCDYKSKSIILNAHHIDIHPKTEVINTIRHEIAHALTPGQGHNDVWATKAREVGCDNTIPCSHLTLPDHVIDAIRSGNNVEVTIDEQIIRTPKYTVTRLLDKCTTILDNGKPCGKVAKEKSSTIIKSLNQKWTTLECGHIRIVTLPKETPYEKLVNTRGHKPYGYQVTGMRFLELAMATRNGAAIFDEMGLGKTPQAMGYLKFADENFLSLKPKVQAANTHLNRMPVLFLIKSGLKYQFFAEMLSWMGDKYVGQVVKTSKDHLIPGLKTYFASYDIFTPKVRIIKGKRVESGMDIEKISALGIKTVVLDECQQIKNPDSTRTQQIRKLIKLTGAKVIALSGTPWKNRGSELYTVLNMIDPLRFNSFEAFKKRYVKYYYDGNKDVEGGFKDPEGFRELISDIAIRRERNEVMKELPLITRSRWLTELDDARQKVYNDEVSDFVKWYNEKVIGGDEDSIWSDPTSPLIAKLARMRHITGLAKIPTTLEFVKDFLEETDRKMVIFHHHVDVGDLIEEELKEKYGPGTETNIPILRLTGGLDSAKRYAIQQQFNEAPRAILVASQGASGEGLNLQTCADCIMHERQWNPANEEQCEGRFIRIGQKSTAVIGTYVTAQGTVDHFLDTIVERKRAEFHASMNKGEMPIWKQANILKELAEAIVDDYNKQHNVKKNKIVASASL